MQISFGLVQSIQRQFQIQFMFDIKNTFKIYTIISQNTLTINNYKLTILRRQAISISVFNKFMQDQNRIGKYTSQFGKDDVLGSGRFGSVYAGYQVGKPDNEVAIKLINLKSKSKESPQKEIIKEVNIMLSLRSQGTLNILAVGKIQYGKKKQQHYAIVTQKMDGSLRDLLDQKGNLPEEQAIQWAFKIVECYKYLYKASIMHRDLKPENILFKMIGEQIMFKIADFGFSRSSKVSKSRLSIKGTPYYISPQQQLQQGKYTDKADVYAFGCMLFQFIVGSEKATEQVCRVFESSGLIIQEKFKELLRGLEISDMMIQFIQGCLEYDQGKRLGWEHIFNNQIFQKFANKGQIQSVQSKKVKINKLRITPDTTTYVWKKNNYYRQENSNQNVCIYQSENYHSSWLCSAQDLSCDGECVFNVKAHKVSTQDWYSNGLQASRIKIGVMESPWKGENYAQTLNHCVYLNIFEQQIYKPNEEQMINQGIKCSCQPTLASLPCLIECHVNRNQNTITWHYNGKHQAKSNMPSSWKDQRKLCVVVMICCKDDYVEFM